MQLEIHWQTNEKITRRATNEMAYGQSAANPVVVDALKISIWPLWPTQQLVDALVVAKIGVYTGKVRMSGPEDPAEPRAVPPRGGLVAPSPSARLGHSEGNGLTISR